MDLEGIGHYLDVLVNKSLISKSKSGLLIMHDLLKELGRDIVRRESEDLGKRSRLFRHEDVFNVLENDTGTDATKAIVVDFCPETKDQILKAQAFSKMTKLRYLKFDNSQTIKWSGDPLKYMPTNELRFLEWTGYHLNSWPSSFQPKNLTVLRMRGSRIEQLWMGSMVLPNLVVFELSNSEKLIETPDLTGVPNLEVINLDGCRSLCEVHPSIGSLKRLKALRLDECSSLEKLPDLSSLECLTDLTARETAITQIPSVNLRPKISNDNISGSVEFYFSGSKLMGLKSRDPIYDIGSLVKYQKEGTYDSLEAAWIDFDSKEENILDIASFVISALDDELNLISGWSLGFDMIPEWVQYKSNGSSVKIDIEVFEMDEEYYVELEYAKILPIWNVSFGKRIGFWVYIPEVLRFLDIRRRVMIKISFETVRCHHFLSKRPFEEKEVEVKECGVHLVCPDDANSNFFNSIAPFGRSGSSNSDFH